MSEIDPQHSRIIGVRKTEQGYVGQLEDGGLFVFDRHAMKDSSVKTEPNDFVRRRVDVYDESISQDSPIITLDIRVPQSELNGYRHLYIPIFRMIQDPEIRVDALEKFIDGKYDAHPTIAGGQSQIIINSNQ